MRFFNGRAAIVMLPNMILDDGGDATLYILLGARAEAGENILPHPATEEEEFLKAQVLKRLAASPWLVHPATRCN
jgi:S-adenosylhomocysteine hydrolase